MAWIAIPDADVDQGSVIDESLMKDKIANNDTDHEARLLLLEAAGGTGGGGADVKENFAMLLAGGNDDIGHLWSKRFYVGLNTIGNGSGAEGFDPEQTHRNDRLFNISDFAATSFWAAQPAAWRNTEFQISKGDQINFRIKRSMQFAVTSSTKKHSVPTTCATAVEVWSPLETPVRVVKGLEKLLPV